jgi:hypothetical protein
LGSWVPMMSLKWTSPADSSTISILNRLNVNPSALECFLLHKTVDLSFVNSQL